MQDSTFTATRFPTLIAAIVAANLSLPSDPKGNSQKIMDIGGDPGFCGAFVDDQKNVYFLMEDKDGRTTLNKFEPHKPAPSYDTTYYMANIQDEGTTVTVKIFRTNGGLNWREFTLAGFGFPFATFG